MIVLFLLEKSALGGSRTTRHLVTPGPLIDASSEPDGVGPAEAWGPALPPKPLRDLSVAALRPAAHPFPLHTGEGHAVRPVGHLLPQQTFLRDSSQCTPGGGHSPWKPQGPPCLRWGPQPCHLQLMKTP